MKINRNLRFIILIALVLLIFIFVFRGEFYRGLRDVANTNIATEAKDFNSFYYLVSKGIASDYDCKSAGGQRVNEFSAFQDVRNGWLIAQQDKDKPWKDGDIVTFKQKTSGDEYTCVRFDESVDPLALPDVQQTCCFLRK